LFGRTTKKGRAGGKKEVKEGESKRGIELLVEENPLRP